MLTIEASTDTRNLLDEIEQAQRATAEYSAFYRKLSARLKRTAKALSTKPAVTTLIPKLLSDLESFVVEPPRPALEPLTAFLDEHLQAVKRQLESGLAAELRQQCQARGLDFVVLPDAFGVGPFRVAVNTVKETAVVEYATAVVVNKMPLNPSAIADQAAALKASLIDEPVDIESVNAQLAEAVRVALARKGEFPRDELRGELPAVFQEMAFIRQGKSKAKKGGKSEYTLPRFIVELTHLIQSDLNMQGDRKFRLETAVLENTKKARKSIFIPKELGCGFGEGTYYQAVISRNRNP